MNERLPFLDALGNELLRGLVEFRRRRRFLTVALLAVVVVGGGIVASLRLGGHGSESNVVVAQDPTPTRNDTGPTPTPTSPTADTEPRPPLPACETGEPLAGIDRRVDHIVAAYNARDADALIDIIGDGPVRDPSLEPGTTGEYPSISAWIAAAASIDDHLDTAGYGVYEPFELIASRSNQTLATNDIDALSLRVQLWVNQECETRVTTVDEISQPDPCRYSSVFAVESPSGCAQSFAPRAGHLSIWTGNELIIYGGSSGTYEGSGLATGLAFDPADGSWRDLPPSPAVVASWPGFHGFWTGEVLLVLGRVLDDDRSRILVQSYNPEAETWSVSAPLPADDAALGAAVWTGNEIVMAGGELNGPDDRAWAYRPDTGEWRALPDPGLKPVEGMAGVWNGSEAIFIGGYSGAGGSEGVAYNPAAGQWRQLAPSPSSQSIQGHELFWTGEVVIVASGNAGPEHRSSLSIYDPVFDSWRSSAPIPISAAESLGADWTGTELILWGGYGTYGSPEDDGDNVYGDGAAYDPVTDTWRVLPPSPLTDRCQHTATWTATTLVVFGGLEQCGDPNVLAQGTAAAYDPSTDSWTTMER